MEASRAALAVPGVRQVLADYVTLTKPKVQLLLLLTTITTMYVAGDPSVGLVAITVIGGFLSAGGAGAFNHFYDRDIDAQMGRTASRPVPSGRISPRAALLYAFALQAASFLVLATAANLLSACLALAGFVWYTLVYTVWLKRRSPPHPLPRPGGVRLHPARLPRRAQAPLAAEHRHRGRSGGGPAAGRLGGGDRERRPHRAVPVRDRLLLDAAALLGAQPADEG